MVRTVYALQRNVSLSVVVNVRRIFPDISRNVSSLSDPVVVSKSKRCVAHIWKEGIRTTCFSEYLNGRVHLEDKGVDGRLFLRVIINSVKGCGPA